MLRFHDCSGAPALQIDDSPGHGPPTEFGPYRVLHQVGSGVLGPVFRTHDPVHDRLIAVKSIKLDIVPEDVARLALALRELEARPVDHPGAAAIISSGVENGRPYVATEYLAGESLDIALRQMAPAPLDRALAILDQLAGIVDAAWDAQQGHGALHPRDVFLQPDGRVHVTGIGIGMALHRAGIKPPIRRPYSAPERGEQRPWDRRADVFSLGAIAHELLTGRRLAAAGEQDGSLAALPPDARKAVRHILARALASDPNERFATAAEFAGELRAVAAGAPIVVPDEHSAASDVPRDPLPPLPAIAHVDAATAPVPERAPTAGERDLDRTPQTDPPVWAPVNAPVHTVTSPSPYPWAAIVAVAIAALLLGTAGGYSLGRRAAAQPATRAAADARTDTEVPIESPPPPAPPRTEVVPDARPAANVATPGRVVVRSVPAGAMVTVDGKPAGETPTTVSGLELGAHVVLIARPGYAPRTERVTLTSRQPSRAVTVELTPGLDPVAAQFGSLYVDSRPRAARVLVDGRLVGVTPITVPQLTRGDHSVAIELEGYRTHTTTVTVRPGEQAKVALTLGREERE